MSELGLEAEACCASGHSSSQYFYLGVRYQGVKRTLAGAVVAEVKLFQWR